MKNITLGALIFTPAIISFVLGMAVAILGLLAIVLHGILLVYAIAMIVGGILLITLGLYLFDKFETIGDRISEQPLKKYII